MATIAEKVTVTRQWWDDNLTLTMSSAVAMCRIYDRVTEHVKVG